MQSQTNLPLHHLENCFKFEILLLTIAHKHRRYIIEQRQATFQNTVFKNRFRVKLDNRMRTPQWSHCFVFSQLKIMTRKWTMAFCINMNTQQKKNMSNFKSSSPCYVKHPSKMMFIPCYREDYLEQVLHVFQRLNDTEKIST